MNPLRKSTRRALGLALAVMTAAACRGESEPDAATSSARVPDIYLPRDPSGRPILFMSDPAAKLEPEATKALTTRLDQLAAVGPSLPAISKALLQNDVWGLRQRLEAEPLDSSEKAALLDRARAVMRALAPSSAELLGLQRPDPERPKWLERFVEHDSEHGSLMHERLYGFRRLFRIYLDGRGGRALVSRLVVLDQHDRPQLTEVIAEIELLVFQPAPGSEGRPGDPRLQKARVFERAHVSFDRPSGPPLVELHRVEQVPGPSANGTLAVFAEADQPIERLPCLRCHDDPEMMSLPVPLTEPGARHAKLLSRHAGK